MTDRRIGLFWPLGARVFLAAGVVTFAVTLLRTGRELGWPYQEWAHTNALFQSSMLDFTGPLAAAFGGYLSGRLTPPSRMYALPRFARDRAQFLAQALLPAAMVITGGYLLAAVPIVLRTYQTATIGSLAPASVVAGVLVLNTLFVVGWLIGLLAQSAFAAPVAFGAAFAATLVGYVGGPVVNAVTPVILVSSVVSANATPAFTAFRVCFFTVVLVGALLTAGGVLTGRGFERRPPHPRHLAVWLLPVAFIAVAVVRPLPVWAYDPDAPRTCRDAGGLQFCVHQSHAKAIGPLIDEVAPVIALVGRVNLPFDRIYDWTLSDGSSPPKDPEIFYVDISPRYGVTGAGSAIIGRVSGIDVCGLQPGATDSDQENNSFMLSVRLGGDRENRPDNRFGPISDQQLRQWLTQHRRQAATCTITNDMLP